ncbi:MAG: acetyl-CoA carboxylase biotin carboxyl carrier protein subunit [Bacteroidales bacterium]|nr:acetyl-CoA carboxylase biotin carboxyl carrier protein subunit [Bacteroidales bacterium]MCF8403602.1 acetyl-CoA carboxylase biotin carboxyl carrier protein subunit [Bacteroidales bacterium]
MNYKSLLIENIKYRTLLTEKYKQRKPFEKKNEKIMTAYIPGSVREIFVKPNKKVQIGDKLLVLEAMKMKNEILAPISGVIKSIHVSVGDKLRKDDLILEFK